MKEFLKKCFNENKIAVICYGDTEDKRPILNDIAQYNDNTNRCWYVTPSYSSYYKNKDMYKDQISYTPHNFVCSILGSRNCIPIQSASSCYKDMDIKDITSHFPNKRSKMYRLFSLMQANGFKNSPCLDKNACPFKAHRRELHTSNPFVVSSFYALEDYTLEKNKKRDIMIIDGLESLEENLMRLFEYRIEKETLDLIGVANKNLYFKNINEFKSYVYNVIIPGARNTLEFVEADILHFNDGIPENCEKRFLLNECIAKSIKFLKNETVAYNVSGSDNAVIAQPCNFRNVFFDLIGKYADHVVLLLNSPMGDYHFLKSMGIVDDCLPYNTKNPVEQKDATYNFTFRYHETPKSMSMKNYELNIHEQFNVIGDIVHGSSRSFVIYAGNTRVYARLKEILTERGIGETLLNESRGNADTFFENLKDSFGKKIILLKNINDVETVNSFYDCDIIVSKIKFPPLKNRRVEIKNSIYDWWYSYMTSSDLFRLRPRKGGALIVLDKDFEMVASEFYRNLDRLDLTKKTVMPQA